MNAAKPLLFLALTFVQATYAQQKPPPQPIRSNPVNGSVFIVTNGGSSIKLGLVTIAVYDPRVLQPQIDSSMQAAKVYSEELAEDKTRLEAEWVEKNNVVDTRRKEWQQASFLARKSRGENSYHNNAYAADKAFERLTAAISDASEAKKAYENILLTYRAALAAPTYIKSFKGAIDTQKTDADGSFAFALRPGEYIASAIASRQVGGNVEDYSWLVRFKVNNKPTRLILSNDNMLNTKCAECVQFLPQ